MDPEDSRPPTRSGARAWWDSVASRPDDPWEPAGQVADDDDVPPYVLSRRAKWISAAMGATGIAAGIAIFVAFGGHPQPRHGHRGSAPCHSRASSPAQAGALPGYYIALADASGPARTAGIYATDSGCELAEVAPGGRQAVVDVSAADDDQTFAIATKTPQDSGRATTAFYLVRLDPASRSARLTRLALAGLPGSATLEAFALSPDGGKLAVAFIPGSSAPLLSQEIKVLTIATGKVRSWLSSKGAVTGPHALSWASDNSTLAFSWLGRHRLHPRLHPLHTSGLRLLSTRRPGDNIVDDSRLAVRFRNQHGLLTAYGYLSGRAVLTADRKALVSALTGLSGLKNGFGEFSVTTGRLKHKIDWHLIAAGSGTAPADVLWTDQTASTLIVFSPPGYPGKLGVLRNGQFTPLRRPAHAAFPAAAW